MKVVINLAVTIAVMVLLLLAAATLGGIGVVELSVWGVVLAALLVVVAVRSRRQAST